MSLSMWFITDGRLGHLAQLRGFAERLGARADVTIRWLDLSVNGFQYGDRDKLLAQFSATEIPDWVVGAGRPCHAPMMWCKRRLKCRAIVLSKPSTWPLCLFDAACIPAHDGPPQRDNVLATQGVLNNIVPQRQARDAHRGLVLLGGISTHYLWNDTAVLEQVLAVAEASPKVTWLLSDSPRTPDSLREKLAALSVANLQWTPYSECPPGWLKRQLAELGQVWVSRDSVSMVYECITSGAPTGLLLLDEAKNSRVTRSMKQVLAGSLAADFASQVLEQPLAASSSALWEADRAADWFLKRYAAQ